MVLNIALDKAEFATSITQKIMFQGKIRSSVICSKKSIILYHDQSNRMCHDLKLIGNNVSF